MEDKHTVVTPVKASRQKKPKEYLYHLWLLSRWLSLDVAVGAVICSAMACKLMGVVPMPVAALSILGLTVWVIYTLDHVWDVRKSGGRKLSPRRQFHRHYQKELAWMAGILVFLIGVGVWMYMPLVIIHFGIGLGSLVVIYLWLVNKLGVANGAHVFHKEPVVALLYTAGVWGIAFLYSDRLPTQPIHVCLGLLFLLLALQNLLLFSLYEHEEDFHQAQRSMVQTYGVHKVKLLIVSSFVVFALIAIYTGSVTHTVIEQKALLTLIVMCLLLLLLFAFPQVFHKSKIYRPLGDGVFLLPVWMFIV